MQPPSSPAALDLRVCRWTPFDDTIAIEGVALAGATMRAQVRAYPDAAGAALIDLQTATPPAEGLSASVDASGPVPVTAIRIIINETTIEGLLPFPGNGTEPGQDVELAWDMHVTATGFKKGRWFQGRFVIAPGSTQA